MDGQLDKVTSKQREGERETHMLGHTRRMSDDFGTEFQIALDFNLCHWLGKLNQANQVQFI